MFHEIRFEQDENGRMYVSKVIFDTADVFEHPDFHVQGYEGKSIHELMESGEIKSYITDCGRAGSVDMLEFTRPVSLDRFLLMFGGVANEDFEEYLKLDDELYEKDPKYVY
jgi:hypothetical protein